MTGTGPDLDGDAALVSGGVPPSARVPLNLRVVVSAAIALIEDAGLPALTMRRLGQALGVEAMALYRYVPGREDLLDAVVDQVICEMREDPDVPTRPEAGWQDFMQRLAHGIRRTALTYPQCFPLVASRPPAAPWLRPPLRSLDWVETFLQGLMDEGFSDEAAVAAYRAFSSFLLGHLLLEVAALGAAVGPLDLLDGVSPDDDTSGAPLSTAGYPAVVHLADRLAQNHAVVEFEESLESLLDRISRLIAPL